MDKTHKWKMRLIDADELCADRVSNDPVVIAAKCAPTIDAEPVRHGHWDDSFDGITPYCSVCGMSHNCINRTPDYCPHCGAKMEGRANDGQNPQMEDETD